MDQQSMNNDDLLREPAPPIPTSDPLDTCSAVTPKSDDDDFDASEYVRKLIARMGSTGSVPTVATPKVDAKPPEKRREKPKATPITTPPVENSTALLPRLPLGDAPQSLDELKPDHTAGEPIGRRARDPNARPVDLTKLREAANLSTSTVLHVFDCQGLVRRAYAELIVAGVAMVTSLLLLTMSNQIRSLAFAACVIMLGVAAISTGRYALTTRVLNEKLRLPRQ